MQELVTKRDAWEVFLTVVARWWWLLLAVPLGVGAIVYFALSLSPTYRSTALLDVTRQEAELLRTNDVISAALSKIQMAARPADVREAMSDEWVPETTLYRVTIHDASAERAQAILASLVDELINASRPVDDERANLEFRLSLLETSVKELRDALSQMADLLISPPAAGGEALDLGGWGQSMVTLVEAIEKREIEVASLRRDLVGSVSASDVIQGATLRAEPVENRRTAMAALSAVASFAALLGLLTMMTMRRLPRGAPA